MADLAMWNVALARTCLNVGPAGLTLRQVRANWDKSVPALVDQLRLRDFTCIMSILSKCKCVFYKAWNVIIYILFIYYLDIIFHIIYTLIKCYLDII